MPIPAKRPYGPTRQPLAQQRGVLIQINVFPMQCYIIIKPFL
jgi:hypothetical protein